MDDPNRVEEFTHHVQGGGKVEAGDWMPEEYRKAVLKFVEMHANSELMGVLPEREWINKAPTLKRKLALTAKVQDEVGHAELLYRAQELLGGAVDDLPQHVFLRFDVGVERAALHVQLAGDVAHGGGVIPALAEKGAGGGIYLLFAVERHGPPVKQTLVR